MGGLNETDRLRAAGILAKKASVSRVALASMHIVTSGATKHPRASFPVDRALVDHIKAHGVPVGERRFKVRENGDRAEVIDGCRRTMAGLIAEKELQREAPRQPPLEWDRADPKDPGRLYVDCEVVICTDVELVLMRLDANVSRGLPDSKSVLAAIVTSLIKLNRNVLPEGDLMARLVAAMPRGVGASEIVALSMWENLDAELRTALDHPDVPIGLLVPITKARAEDRPALFQRLMRDGVKTAKGATRRANKASDERDPWARRMTPRMLVHVGRETSPCSNVTMDLRILKEASRHVPRDDLDQIMRCTIAVAMSLAANEQTEAILSGLPKPIADAIREARAGKKGAAK